MGNPTALSALFVIRSVIMQVIDLPVLVTHTHAHTYTSLLTIAYFEHRKAQRSSLVCVCVCVCVCVRACVRACVRE